MPRVSSKNLNTKGQPVKYRRAGQRKLPNSAIKKLESVRRRQRKIFLSRLSIVLAVILFFGFSLFCRIFNLL